MPNGRDRRRSIVAIHEPSDRSSAADCARCEAGAQCPIHGFVNLYGCEIGDETRIGSFVEIQKGAKIGPRCKISSHTFICEGVTIEAEVFIGHGVTFINDRRPRATTANGRPKGEADWECEKTLVKRGASIGSGATLLGGITIGENAIVGAGSVSRKMFRRMRPSREILPKSSKNQKKK